MVKVYGSRLALEEGTAGDDNKDDDGKNGQQH